jgi:hypothetical protein
MQRNDFIRLLSLSGTALLSGFPIGLYSKNDPVDQLAFQAHVRHGAWGIGIQERSRVGLPHWIQELELHRFLSNGYDHSAGVLEHCMVKTKTASLSIQWSNKAVWCNGVEWENTNNETPLHCSKTGDQTNFYLIRLHKGAPYTFRKNGERYAVMLNGHAKIDSTYLAKGQGRLIDNGGVIKIIPYKETQLLLITHYDKQNA